MPATPNFRRARAQTEDRRLRDEADARTPACPCCKQTRDVRPTDGPRAYVCNHCDADWCEPARVPHFDVVSRAPWYVASNPATHHAWADRR